MRDSGKRGYLCGGCIQLAGRHRGGAQDGSIPKAARIEHRPETAHYSRITAFGDEVDQPLFRAAKLARDSLERPGAQRDAALEFGQGALFGGDEGHFFSDPSGRLYG